eukprot:364390-Chlamydomonas_euryale.AAC.6
MSAARIAGPRSSMPAHRSSSSCCRSQTWWCRRVAGSGVGRYPPSPSCCHSHTSSVATHPPAAVTTHPGSCKNTCASMDAHVRVVAMHLAVTVLRHPCPDESSHACRRLAPRCDCASAPMPGRKLACVPPLRTSL